MAFLRLFIFGFLVLSVLYLAISVYSRSVRREKLEKRWEEDHPGDHFSAAREEYVENGMIEYQNGLRRKLILLVYVIPTLAVVAIAVIVNVF